MTNRTEVHALAEDLFRRESGRLIALLTRRVGAARIEWVEDAVQDALAAAMRTWSREVPARPAAWLYTAARNALLARIQRTRLEVSGTESVEIAEEADESFPSEAAFNDDLLRLIAYCCHPALSPASQLALTLRLACGLSVDEIAAALLMTRESIAQRIVRAKRELRSLHSDLELSPAELVRERQPRIMNALYLLFDAGYLSLRHREWVRPVLCGDALRLSRLLVEHETTSGPAAAALAALLHLTAARLPARIDESGTPIRLAEQDRSKWDASLIAAGMRYLNAAVGAGELTRYHIEAGIAALHASATSIATTNWPAILDHYDTLCAHYPSPVATLNRIIALRYARGATEAFAALIAADELETIQDSLVYYATLGELHEALGEPQLAADAFRCAAARTNSDAMKRLFTQRWSKVLAP